MGESGAIFGGEHSGHFYFAQFWRADSGMLAALHAIAALGTSDKTLSELLKPYARYISSIWEKKKMLQNNLTQNDIKKIRKIPEKIYLYESSSRIKKYNRKDKMEEALRNDRNEEKESSVLIYKSLNDKKEEIEHVLSLCKL